MRGVHQPTGSGAPATAPNHKPSSSPGKPLIFDEVDNSLATALTERGVTWPIGGYAPGKYIQTCRTCDKTHTADKRAWSCLACVVAATIAASRKNADDRAAIVGKASSSPSTPCATSSTGIPCRRTSHGHAS
ncbi:hypothetical protein GCM10011335_53190 [Aureimonas glaciei]|uniref:Transposase n=1 Tax=Aureimonas glaciei TaxID=1776957 RepID=A0A916YGT3_9HYPH|nr:hypothetical protein GCM10011335_53190 [Aureimonas glaciei]